MQDEMQLLLGGNFKCLLPIIGCRGNSGQNKLHYLLLAFNVLKNKKSTAKLRKVNTYKINNK